MKKILFVDDDEIFLTFLKSTLISYPFATYVSSALEGRSALLEKGLFDSIVSDFHMPDEDGIHFLSFAHDFNEKSSLFLMSSYLCPQGLPSYINGFFSKPFNPWKIVGIIN